MCVDDAGGSQGTENKLWHLTFVGSHRRGIAAWRNNPGRLPGVGGLWGIEEEVAVFELAVGSDSPGVVHSVAPQRPANARRSRGSMLACSENKPSGPTPTSFRKARGAARACAPQNVPTRPPRLRHRPHPPPGQCAGAWRARAGVVILCRTPLGELSRTDGVAMEPRAGEEPPDGPPERRAGDGGRRRGR